VSTASAPGISNASDLFVTILPYAAAIVALAIVGGVVMMISRRKIDSAARGGPIGFTLADLKELRERGELSEQEYDRARQEVIDRARRAFRDGGNGPAVR